jgi:hypothetical protein
MWQTDTYWFDVAIATGGLMLGHLFFGRFVEHTPRWRRLLKALLTVALIVGTTALAGRFWTYVLIGAIAVGILVVHGWWLPRNGVNGWTAEPRDRYYALMGLDPSGKPRDRASQTEKQ